jgi:hypothetical protein
MINEEAAVQKFTDEIIAALGDSDTIELEDRKVSFKRAFDAALVKLTKEEITAILFFVIADYEIFFDIFEQSAARSRRGA